MGAFDALIHEPRNLQIAMDFARGSEERALQSDPEVLLQKMTESLTEESDKKHSSELAGLRREHRREIREAQDELATLKGERDRDEEEKVRSVTGAYRRITGRCRIAVSVAKTAFAALIFMLTFSTSSILLDKIDRAFFVGWTLIMSALVGVFVAIPVFLYPVGLIERVVRKFYNGRFRAELASKNLEATASRFDFDWTDYSQKPRINDESLV